jgi:hypothetical protein
MKQEILEIKELIDDLRAIDTEFLVFGARSHRYDVGPKLTESEIREFEKKHAIVLPEDYRLYLQLVGDGSGRQPKPYPYNGAYTVAGAGPDYGIYPLSESIFGDRVSEDFPFEESAECIGGPPYSDWSDNIPGALEICTSGCASHTHLIVKGAKYGTIWDGYGHDHDHFYPTDLTFSQWMRDWAERKLEVFAKQPLYKRIKVGMTIDEIIAETGEGWLKDPSPGRIRYRNKLIPAEVELDDRKVVTGILTSL